MSVSKIFDKFTDDKPSKKDKNDLATILERAGYERNSKKEFCVPTTYTYPIQQDVLSNEQWSDDTLKEHLGI